MENIEINSTQIPDNVKVTAATLIIKTNINNLDLDEVYDRTLVSSDGIQIVKHGYNVKHSDSLSPRNIKSLDKQRKSKGFNNCLQFSFENQSIKLFKNGSIQLTGKYDALITDYNINRILDIIPIKDELIPKITYMEITILLFDINIDKIDTVKLKSELIDNDEIFLTAGLQGSVCNPSVYKYKNNTFRIYKSKILGSSKSLEDINEVYKLISKFMVDNDVSSKRCWYKPWSWFS